MRLKKLLISIGRRKQHMEQIKTKEQLEEKIAHCTKCLHAKLTSNEKRSVLICGGTGCLANESKEILEKIREEIKNEIICFPFM